MDAAAAAPREPLWQNETSVTFDYSTVFWVANYLLDEKTNQLIPPGATATIVLVEMQMDEKT